MQTRVTKHITPHTNSELFEESVARVCSGRAIECFHRGRGLFLLLAVATGFYKLKVPNWESLPPKY